ncbi:MAG: acyltransferase [Lachnospiraceae bacterium]|nr:acyltransferase [Lachnospiraceae bacterium]
MIKNLLSEALYLTNKIIMWLPLTILRIYWLKILGCKIGKQVYIARNVEVRKAKNISIDNNTIINSKVLLDGRGGKLSIGRNVDIAQEVIIWTESHDPHDDNHHTKDAPVSISDHVWIGCRSMIMPGVSIGKGGIVAASAVVTKDVNSKEIVAGIPAKVIGKRRNNLKYTLNHYNYFK